MTDDNDFIIFQIVFALAVLIVGGIVLWNFYLRYDGSAVNVFVSADSSLPTRLERDKNRSSTWLVKNRGVTVGEATMNSKHVGHYEFTVVVSNDPRRLVPQSTFALVGGDGSTGGVIACLACVSMHTGSPILPPVWALADL